MLDPLEVSLAGAMAEARRQGGRCCLLLLHLDEREEVARNLGRGEAQHFVDLATRRFAAVLGPEDSLARVDGQILAVVQAGAETACLEALARRLAGALAAPVALRGNEVTTTASIGIAVYPDDAVTPEALWAAADRALERARRGGPGRLEWADPAEDARDRARRLMLRELRAGLDRDEIELDYQPQYTLAGGRLVGVEALVRWRHPTEGLLSPDAFVPLAEAGGLIGALSRHVLHLACRQAAAWAAAGTPIRVAVNVSAAELARGGSPPPIREALAATGLDPTLLELEITETAYMGALEAGAAAFFAEVASLGIGVALDDFGVGYSSLGSLRDLPATKIKIDRSFVRRLAGPNQPAAELLLAALIGLGRGLGKCTLAEGIETRDQLDVLRRLGCEQGQGFHLVPPRGPDAIATLLRGG